MTLRKKLTALVMGSLISGCASIAIAAGPASAETLCITDGGPTCRVQPVPVPVNTALNVIEHSQSTRSFFGIIGPDQVVRILPSNGIIGPD